VAAELVHPAALEPGQLLPTLRRHLLADHPVDLEHPAEPAVGHRIEQQLERRVVPEHVTHLHNPPALLGGVSISTSRPATA
jgi:hypothetical protein